MKWKLEIEMKLLGKNGIIIEIEILFRMEITLISITIILLNNEECH